MAGLGPRNKCHHLHRDIKINFPHNYLLRRSSDLGRGDVNVRLMVAQTGPVPRVHLQIS